MAGCADGSSPDGAAGIEFVAGAVEPILTRGERFVIEGSGFGAEPGLLVFTRIGGGIIERAVADSDWTPFTVVAIVPDSAAPGHVALALETASGTQLVATINVLPRSSIDPLTLAWTPRGTFPGAPSGLGVTAAEFPAAGGVLRTTLYAAGGAEPPQMTPDSGVYVARVTRGGAGAIDPWIRQRDATDPVISRALPAPRAFAATVVATRFNSRFRGSALYVIGGIDRAGRAQASVLGADISEDSVTGHFVPLEPLPTPLAGAIAVVRHGRIYVMGGTDALGRPQSSVYTGRIGADGHIDGWFIQPPLSGPRAFGGGIARDGGVVAIGGVADSAGLQRLVTGDTASVSMLSGFFTGSWGAGGALLPEGRSHFALLDFDSKALIVGGMYAGALTNAAETLVASVTGDSVGPFTGPAGTNRIADLMCITDPAGTLVGPAGITWREADGTHRGLLVGGLDLATQTPRRCAWGF